MSSHLILTLWVIQPVIQIMIAVVYYRRKLHKEFPAFFSYIIAQVVIFCAEFPIFLYERAGLYFYVYWLGAAVNLVLAFRIVYEVFLDIFKPYHALKDLGTALFKWAALVMVLVSVVLISVSPSADNPFTATILVVHRCVGVVQCGLVIFLLAFCRDLGVNRRRLSFGIALGFGLISGSELLTTAMYSGARLTLSRVNVITMSSYVVGTLIWLLYSKLNRRSDLVPVLVPQRWDQALSDIHASQTEADSLIPMFEHMVDQALSKANNTHA